MPGDPIWRVRWRDAFGRLRTNYFRAPDRATAARAFGLEPDSDLVSRVRRGTTIGPKPTKRR